jgi:TRAP transporter TAXI family solute receptor
MTTPSPLFIKQLSAFLLACVLLAGCDNPPTDAALTADLSTYVDARYAPGLLQVTRAERPHPTWLPDFNRESRTVAYAAELRLKRDYDFGVWDQAGAATLTHLLGARPQSLKGLRSEGNKTGDLLQVSGTVIYVREKDSWRLLAGAAPPTTSEATLAWRARRELIGEWWFATKVAARGLFSRIDAVDADFVFAGVKATTARLMRERADGQAQLAIASGRYGDNTWTLVQALASDAKTKGTQPVINLETSGSRENLRLLRDGAVSAAVVRGDEAAFALNGEGPFARDGTFPDLRALGALFPEQIHVVVLSGSPIASVADLFNKRVAIAGDALTTGIGAGDALRAHRVPLASLAATPEIRSIQQTLVALEKGECDAVIITAPAPIAALQAYAATHPIRLVPLDADALALMTTGTSNYVTVTIPAQTYPGQSRPVATAGFITLLVSSAAIQADEVQAVLRQTYGGVDFLGAGSALGALVRPAFARRGVTLPLHPGAEAFFGIPVAAKDGGK